MKIVVLGLQGAFLEHVECVKRAMAEMKIKGTVIIGKVPADLEGADGIILPGGESTTINRLLRSSGLSDVLKRSKAAILATCAGMVLVSSGGDAQCAHTGGLLGLIDMRVNRNAFGRQKDSFEEDIEISGLGRFHGIFIRAPCVEAVADPEAKVIGTLGGKIVAVEKGKILALAFHPELGSDLRLHKRFLEHAK